MNTELINRIEELFLELLKSKTGWGRVEIAAAYKEAQRQALLEFVDKYYSPL